MAIAYLCTTVNPKNGKLVSYSSRWHFSSNPEKSGKGVEMSAVWWSDRHADVVTYELRLKGYMCVGGLLWDK